MALPQTANSNDITSVIASLAPRQANKAKTAIAGPKRAAILMLALGEQYGGKIWELLDDDEVRELSITNSSRVCPRRAR
jgi:flagellar motor switch protein FliG